MSVFFEPVLIHPFNICAILQHILYNGVHFIRLVKNGGIRVRRAAIYQITFDYQQAVLLYLAILPTSCRPMASLPALCAFSA